MRELGLGLEDVRRVLERETTVAAVAAVQVKALDVTIRTLRLRRAVLSTVAKRQSDHEEMTLLNKLARLSAEERRQIIDEFTEEVFGGVDTDPEIMERMRHTAVELPDDPTPEQVDAWVQLAELVQDPGFRLRMRGMAEFNAAQGREPGAYQWFAKKVNWLVGGARERGVAPDSSEAADILAQLLGGTDTARRAKVLQRLEGGADNDAERYRQQLAVVNGQPPQPSRATDYAWLIDALRAHR